jgi:thioredoxin 1
LGKASPPPSTHLAETLYSSGFPQQLLFLKKSGIPIGNTTVYQIRSAMNRQLSKKDFNNEVIANRHLSLVQFKKEWNGASQIIEPVYNELATTYNGVVNFFTVDVEKDRELDTEFGVMDIPTILFFKSGKIVDYAIGLTPKNILISKIENAIVAGND